MDSAADLPLLGGVAPFGDPRIKACSRLPKAYRSVPRPSSPLGAKASTRCPCFPRPPPATTAAIRDGCDGRRRKTVPATTYKVGPPASDRAGGPHTHANDVLARRRKRPQRRAKTSTCRCPPPGTPDLRLSCRRSGHLVTTSRCPRNTPGAATQKKGGAGRTGSCRLQAAGSVPGPRGPAAPGRSRQVLVGLGRLERPTSRLSGVRSNQLSYRPEHHPAGPDTRRRGQGHEPRPSPPADPVRRLFAKGRADGGRNDPDGQ